MSTKFDGDFLTPTICGPVVPEWLDEEQCTIWHVPYCARVGGYAELAFGAAIPGVDGKVVSNGTPRVVGADVIEWEVITSDVPPTRTEPVRTVYAYQFVTGGNLVEIAGPVTAVATYTYTETTTPFTISALNARRKVQVGATIYTIGDDPPTSGYLMVEDDQLRRWRGNIWEHRRLEVPEESIT